MDLTQGLISFKGKKKSKSLTKETSRFQGKKRQNHRGGCPYTLLKTWLLRLRVWHFMEVWLPRGWTIMLTIFYMWLMRSSLMLCEDIDHTIVVSRLFFQLSGCLNLHLAWFYFFLFHLYLTILSPFLGITHAQPE